MKKGPANRAPSPGGLSTSAVRGGKNYLITTCMEGPGIPHAVTKVCLDDKVVFEKRTELLRVASGRDYSDVVIERQHRSVLDTFSVQGHASYGAPSEYLERTKVLLIKGLRKEALGLMEEAAERHPGDPFVLSYYGSLLSAVGGNHEGGVDCCRRAVMGLYNGGGGSSGFYRPALYMNLGRAYLLAGRKKAAFDSFLAGLGFDGGNGDIIREIKRLGLRRRPAIPALSRSNPVNRTLGLLLHRLQKSTGPIMPFMSAI